MSRRLVVDANILRGASSTDAGPPDGVRCREVLSDIYAICHRAVVSPALQREYDLHASGYGVRWLSAMTRKDKVVPTAARETGRARRWLQSEALVSERQREELRKDMHLLMAAVETDNLVLSCETNSRDLLRRVVEDDDHTPGWVLVAEDTAAWLADGAPLLPHHRVEAIAAPVSRRGDPRSRRR